MDCTHCGSLKYVKNGGYKGVQHYKCKICSRSLGNLARLIGVASALVSVTIY